MHSGLDNPRNIPDAMFKDKFYIPSITDSRLYEDPRLKMTIDRGLINSARLTSDHLKNLSKSDSRL